MGMDQKPQRRPEEAVDDDASGLRPAAPVSRNTVTDDLSWPDRLVPLAHLGNGGMARVTLAMLHGDFEFSTPVAVKRLLPRLANQPSFVDMFLDEAFVAGRIAHPHVVAVRDVMRHRGEPVMVLASPSCGPTLGPTFPDSRRRTARSHAVPRRAELS